MMVMQCTWWSMLSASPPSLVQYAKLHCTATLPFPWDFSFIIDIARVKKQSVDLTRGLLRGSHKSMRRLGLDPIPVASQSPLHILTAQDELSSVCQRNFANMEISSRLARMH